MTNRRTFIRSLVAGGLVALPTRTGAQQAGKMASIGYLSSTTSAVGAERRQAFIDGLQDHGWVEGKNILVEYRWEDARTPSLDALAGELVSLPLDVIVTASTPASLAIKRTGTKLPVVFAAVSEPIAIGLVDSLAKPGRNFTGLTTINRELMAKRLELLKEAIPALVRVGYLANPNYDVHKMQLTEMDATARRLGLTLVLAEVRASSQFEAAFARIVGSNATAVVVQQDDLFINNRTLIIDSASRLRLPAMYVFSAFPRSGGLMSYGAKAEDLFRRTAGYVDKILKGAEPADLPVARPTTFELVLNLKTAKALGVSIPQSFVVRADEVIQ